MTSLDGAAWTAFLNNMVNNNWINPAYGNGIFCAVGTTAIFATYRSLDGGETWSDTTIAADTARGVAFGVNKFVVIVDFATALGRVINAADADETWVQRTATGSSNWTALGSRGATLIAARQATTGGVMRSTDDGDTWTAFNLPEANDVASIAYGNGVWIIVCRSGTNRVFRSTDDGLTWSAIAAAQNIQWQGVKYGNGVRFVMGLY
jgi:hypothetical protein